jgi:hypothetical protein
VTSKTPGLSSSSAPLSLAKSLTSRYSILRQWLGRLHSVWSQRQVITTDFPRSTGSICCAKRRTLFPGLLITVSREALTNSSMHYLNVPLRVYNTHFLFNIPVDSVSRWCNANRKLSTDCLSTATQEPPDD